MDPLVGWEGCPLSIPHPYRRLRHLDPRWLRCFELGPPTFQTKITPLSKPQSSHQLNPALMPSPFLKAIKQKQQST